MFRILSNRVYIFFILLQWIYFASCDELLQKSINDAEVILIAPGNSVKTISPVNFNWETIGSAEQYRIRIMSPSFDSAQVLLFDTLVNGNTVLLPLESGKYQWKVQAINSVSVSRESRVHNLIIE